MVRGFVTIFDVWLSDILVCVQVVSLRDLTIKARKQRFMSVVQKPVQYVFMYQALVALLQRLKDDDDDTFA